MKSSRTELSPSSIYSSDLLVMWVSGSIGFTSLTLGVSTEGCIEERDSARLDCLRRASAYSRAVSCFAITSRSRTLVFLNRLILMFFVVDSISESGFPRPRFILSDSEEEFMIYLGPFSVFECFLLGGDAYSSEVDESLLRVGFRNLL